MSSFVDQVKEALNSGDPEVRKWFLVQQNYVPFILCGCYAMFSWIIGPALMRKRKPFELRTAMVVFNFLLVAVYIVSLLITFFYLPRLPSGTFCFGGAVVKGGVIYTLATTAWVIYILKYIEFLDTVFFVLRKKENQITFLHVMHHTVVPICGWIMFRTEKGGIQSIPVIINSIVHVIMYTYYGLAAMGPGVRKYLWWKKYLTQIQIIQFCLILVFVAVVAPLLGCKMVISSYIIDFVVGTIFLNLFYKFYKSSFQNKTKLVEIHGSKENDLFKNTAIENEIYANSRNKKHTSTNGTFQKQE